MERRRGRERTSFRTRRVGREMMMYDISCVCLKVKVTEITTEARHMFRVYLPSFP